MKRIVRGLLASLLILSLIISGLDLGAEDVKADDYFNVSMWYTSSDLEEYPDGFSVDDSTRTIRLRNVDNPDAVIRVNTNGDFRIELSGDNRLQGLRIELTGDTELSIAGTGTLALDSTHYDRERLYCKAHARAFKIRIAALSKLLIGPNGAGNEINIIKNSVPYDELFVGGKTFESMDGEFQLEEKEWKKSGFLYHRKNVVEQYFIEKSKKYDGMAYHKRFYPVVDNPTRTGYQVPINYIQTYYPTSGESVAELQPINDGPWKDYENVIDSDGYAYVQEAPSAPPVYTYTLNEKDSDVRDTALTGRIYYYAWTETGEAGDKIDYDPDSNKLTMKNTSELGGVSVSLYSQDDLTIDWSGELEIGRLYFNVRADSTVKFAGNGTLVLNGYSGGRNCLQISGNCHKLGFEFGDDANIAIASDGYNAVNIKRIAGDMSGLLSSDHVSWNKGNPQTVSKEIKKEGYLYTKDGETDYFFSRRVYSDTYFSGYRGKFDEGSGEITMLSEDAEKISGFRKAAGYKVVSMTDVDSRIKNVVSTDGYAYVKDISVVPSAYTYHLGIKSKPETQQGGNEDTSSSDGQSDSSTGSGGQSPATGEDGDSTDSGESVPIEQSGPSNEGQPVEEAAGQQEGDPTSSNTVTTAPSLKTDSSGNKYQILTDASGNKTAAYLGNEYGASDISIPGAIDGAPVTTVTDGALQGNIGLKSLTVPSSIVLIGKNAFSGCTKLKKVNIQGDSLITIGDSAFAGCKNLKKLVIKSKSISQAGTGAFRGLPKKAVAKVPKSCRKSYKKMFKKAGFKGKVK